nr:MAG TPA: hypothetical protein [Caudoviricetes sp.]DAU92460.1 MAG TPA: hypothetical protein [Caudoviricetes sp.]
MYKFKCKDGTELGVEVLDKDKKSDECIKKSPEILIFPDLRIPEESFKVQFKNGFLFKIVNTIDDYYIDGFPSLIKEMNKIQDKLDIGLYGALNFIYTFKDR